MRADLKLSRGAGAGGRSAAGGNEEVCGQLTSIPDRLNPRKVFEADHTEPTGIQVPVRSVTCNGQVSRLSELSLCMWPSLRSEEQPAYEGRR